MENSTKIALGIAAAGYAANRYQNAKQKTQPYLLQHEQNIKMAGGALAFLGLTSAVILEATKKSPKTRKVAFIGLGGFSVAWVVLLFYAIKKMS